MKPLLPILAILALLLTSTAQAHPPAAEFQPEGTWLGIAQFNGIPVPFSLELKKTKDAMSGRMCTKPARKQCLDLTKVALDFDRLTVSIPIEPFILQDKALGASVSWRNGRLEGALSLKGVEFFGKLLRKDRRAIKIYLRKGDRVNEHFQRIGRVKNQRLKSYKDMELRSNCICHCACGTAQPKNACPRRLCNCKPCPRGIP